MSVTESSRVGRVSRRVRNHRAGGASRSRARSEPHDESARRHNVVNAVARRRDREVARAGVDVAHVSAESEPAEAGHIDAAAERHGAGIGVALLRVGTAIRAKLRLAVARVPGAQREARRLASGSGNLASGRSLSSARYRATHRAVAELFCGFVVSLIVIRHVSR